MDSLEHDTRIVFTSSIATYGATMERDPTHKGNPHTVAYNNYAESKIQSEKIVKKPGQPWTILRIAPISVADLLELPETVAYRADQRVECVYVEDAGYALYSCLEGKRKRRYTILGVVPHGR